jgi:hypothetical protein
MTSVERPSYATIVKQTAARFRDGNTLSSNYAQIEYSEGFNQLKLKPAPNAGGGSVSIEQAGGARPELNFYNSSGTAPNSFGSITLETDGRIMSNKNVKIEENGFGGSGQLECRNIRMSPSNGGRFSVSNVQILPTAGVASGTFIRIEVNGVTYKLALLNDS